MGLHLLDLLYLTTIQNFHKAFESVCFSIGKSFSHHDYWKVGMSSYKLRLGRDLVRDHNSRWIVG